MKSGSSKRVHILALDPGTNNFAYSVVRIRSELSDSGRVIGRVLHRGLIHSALRTLNNPPVEREELDGFLGALNHILEAYPIDVIIAERYMLRRGSGGNAIEAINQMIGVIRTLGYPFKMIPASQWKNATHRMGHDLEGAYKSLGAVAAQRKRDPERITVHEVDAAHIGLYGASCILGIPKTPQFKTALGVSESLCTHLGEYTKVVRKKRKRKK